MDKNAKAQAAKLDEVIADIEALPDAKDGVDLSAYKRQAVTGLNGLRNQVVAVFKLAS